MVLGAPLVELLLSGLSTLARIEALCIMSRHVKESRPALMALCSADDLDRCDGDQERAGDAADVGYVPGARGCGVRGLFDACAAQDRSSDEDRDHERRPGGVGSTVPFRRERPGHLRLRGGIAALAPLIGPAAHGVDESG